MGTALVVVVARSAPTCFQVFAVASMRRVVGRGKYVLFPIARRKKKRKPVAASRRQHSRIGRLGPTNRSRRHCDYENAYSMHRHAKENATVSTPHSRTVQDRTRPTRFDIHFRADCSSGGRVERRRKPFKALQKQASWARDRSFHKVRSLGSSFGVPFKQTAASRLCFYFSKFRMRKVANRRERPPLHCTGFCANKNQPCMQASRSLAFHPTALGSYTNANVNRTRHRKYAFQIGRKLKNSTKLVRLPTLNKKLFEIFKN